MIEKLSLKRNNKINDYLHKTSRFIVNYCVKHNIGNIVNGYNKGWKEKVKIGSNNNQKFVSIPFFKLINQIKYKSELAGITVETVKENHTSKCDSLILEEINHHNKNLGKRKKRGLFQSSLKTVINADVNGALNILRNVIGDSFIRKIVDRGKATLPLSVIPYK
jgi:putative transposase